MPEAGRCSGHFTDNPFLDKPFPENLFQETSLPNNLFPGKSFQENIFTEELFRNKPIQDKSFKGNENFELDIRNDIFDQKPEYMDSLKYDSDRESCV